MKIIITLLTACVFSFGAMAQTNASGNSITAIQNSTLQPKSQSPSESLALNEMEFDFGKIPQGKPVTHVFEFKNTGTTPFSLDNVQASCGCTTPEWTKDVVAPGATSKIIVGYNAQNEGTFAKPVTITYNGNQTKQIVIKGEVWKTPENSAPENTKINSLKNE
ncbi:MAG: DUF1573 domain-containing protein [Ginsengibacter sp.]